MFKIVSYLLVSLAPVRVWSRARPIFEVASKEDLLPCQLQLELAGTLCVEVIMALLVVMDGIAVPGLHEQVRNPLLVPGWSSKFCRLTITLSAEVQVGQLILPVSWRVNFVQYFEQFLCLVVIRSELLFAAVHARIRPSGHADHPHTRDELPVRSRDLVGLLLLVVGRFVRSSTKNSDFYDF